MFCNKLEDTQKTLNNKLEESTKVLLEATAENGSSISTLSHTMKDNSDTYITNSNKVILVLDTNGRCYVQNRKLTKFVELESHVPAMF